MEDSALYLQAMQRQRQRYGGNQSQTKDAQRIYGQQHDSYEWRLEKQREHERRRRAEEEERKQLAQTREQLREAHADHARKLAEMENEKSLLLKMLKQKPSTPPVAPAAVVAAPAAAPVAAADDKEENLCVVCMNAKRNIVCIPCAHVALCHTCSAELTACPICMGKAEMKKMFFA
jgi:hypothetical protein